MKFLIFSIIITAGFQMIIAQNNEGFALYLLPEDIKAEQLSKLDIRKIKPKDKPFLTTGDIRSYVRDTHEIAINYTAADRLKQLKVSPGGRPFIVFVGSEPIYTGAFWNGFTSMTFRGVAVDISNLRGDFPVITLELDYPPLAPKNTGFDPRADERIFKVLEKAGDLFEQVWLKGKCTKISPTGKRRQSFIFTFAVSEVVKAKYDSSEVIFELYFDALGGNLREILRAEQKAGTEEIYSQKEFLLKFARQVSAQNFALYLKEFTVID